MFAGGTTPVGFVNFFDYAMPLEKAQRRFFLKGSSGSGKSTFLKKIAASFEGYDTDIYHCANDADSLDGLSVRDKGLCIFDGTAPHVRDPEITAAIDSIIDFAAFIDETGISMHTGEIKALLRKKKLLTEKARGYLSAAGQVYSTERTAFEAALTEFPLQSLINKWQAIFDSACKPKSAGADRKMFLTAVTPDGVISFADTVLSGCRVYGLKSESGAGADIFLARLRDAAHANGINTESFHCPFEPDKLEYLLLPEMKTAFAVIGARCGYKGRVDEIIDFEGCYDPELLEIAKAGTDRGGVLFDRLLDESVALMNESRILHAGIERIYIDTIDFSEINKMTERIIGLLHSK